MGSRTPPAQAKCSITPTTLTVGNILAFGGLQGSADGSAGKTCFVCEKHACLEVRLERSS